MSVVENIQVEEVTSITDELLAAWQKLMPQLSTSAPAPSKEWLEALIKSDSVMLVARLDGQIVGSLTLVLTRIPVGMKAWIEDVVVAEGQRGKRIGEALTLAAIKKAEEAKARNINLESRPSRVAAHRLYQRVGFEVRETSVYRYKKG